MLIKIFLTILIVGIILGGRYLLKLNGYKRKVSQIEIKDVDISKKKDGKYLGSCDVDFISAKVAVEIKDGKIEDINLIEHKHDHGERGEKVIEYVKENNRVNVDTISGATNSSKVILKSIENALED